MNQGPGPLKDCFHSMPNCSPCQPCGKQLYGLLGPLERGALATDEDKATVDKVASKLERYMSSVSHSVIQYHVPWLISPTGSLRLNPTPKPLSSPLCSGSWELK